MQVSWIDADRLRELVAQIAPQDERAAATPSLTEIETAPGGGAAWEPAAGFAQVMDEPDESAERSAAETPRLPETCAEQIVVTEIAAETPASADMPDGEEHDSHGHVLHNPAAALPLSRIRDKLRAIRQSAVESGILTRPAEPPPSTEMTVEAAGASLNDGDCRPEVECASQATEANAGNMAVQQSVPSFEIPRGSRDERLSAFAGWARQVLRADGGHVLVMSDDGEVLWGGEAKAGLVLSTMMAWGAAMRAGAAVACAPPPVMRQPLASGHVLTVIPCETGAGVVHAAVAAPEGLADDVALVLRGALCAAMAAEQRR